MKILIIGGGAAGLAAAVSARKENKNADITVVERNDRVAKKILATGNGRCNFTNRDIDPRFYFGDRSFIAKVLERFGTDEATGFFSSLGVAHREEDGRIYPRSNQAQAVADALRLFLSENNVRFEVGKKISSLKYENGRFNADGITADRVIAATGGKAAPAFGTDGSSYSLLTSFGHTKTELRPALTAIKTDTEKIKGLKGVRVFARVCLLLNGKTAAEDTGEVLFTDYGLSGIPVMQLSRFAERGAVICVDMLPEMSYEEAKAETERRIRLFPKREGGELFTGLVNKKTAPPLLKYAKVDKASVKAEDFTEENIRKSAEFLKRLRLTVTGDNGFQNAQTTRGGIELKDFDPATMESRLRRGLYAAGEALDCDGLCGGYNLHWAWATGCIAGKSAAR